MKSVLCTTHLRPSRQREGRPNDVHEISCREPPGRIDSTLVRFAALSEIRAFVHLPPRDGKPL